MPSSFLCGSCCYSDDSASWPHATADEFEPVPRICRTILAAYEPDPRTPEGSHGLNPDWIIKHVNYEKTQGRTPPYVIYIDHLHREIVLAIRGLNLANRADFITLLDNRLGMQMFDGGYVHHGLLKSAVWLLAQEFETLKNLWVENGRSYTMVFAGHSLGSGVAATLTVVVVNHLDRLGGIPRNLIRCYAVAPARCMSLNLAVRYSDVIHSIILQDDFLPRTPTPLEDHFKAICCLPCFLLHICVRDTFITERRKISDPRRIYPPGRMYHIVYKKFCRCGRFPPEVRTAIPVNERFGHIVFSCNAGSDHEIIWIERESQKALEMMKANAEATTTPPMVQRFERKQTREKEDKDAVDRAVHPKVPHAVPLTVEPIDETDTDPCLNVPQPVPSTDEPAGTKPSDDTGVEAIQSGTNQVPCSEPKSRESKWDALVEKYLANKSGNYGSKNTGNTR